MQTNIKEYDESFDLTQALQKKGTKEYGFIHLAQRANGSWVNIPIMLAVGAQDGPTLVVDACNHGDEYEGTEGIIKTFEGLDVSKMKGSFIGIPALNAEAFAAVESGTVKKGDVLGVARIAGIMATKRTSELIPLCHPLPLTKVSVDFRLLPERQAVEALCTVKTAGVTGVEMEALTGVSTALLTIYDMCKAVDKGMELGEIHLVEKTGGKSGHYIRAEGGYV